MITKYSIDTTLDGDYDDYYASYALVADGNTLEELIADAHIFEVDQDGGSGKDYKLEDAGGGLYKDAVEYITHRYNTAKEDADSFKDFLTKDTK